MSYYDPWAHNSWLFFNRAVLGFFASLVLTVALWCWLLTYFFDCTAPVALRCLWNILQGNIDMTSRLMLVLTASTCLFFTTTVFVLLLRFGRLGSGDRHRRGARVVGNDDRKA